MRPQNEIEQLANGFRLSDRRRNPGSVTELARPTRVVEQKGE
jgi:hypothetical protein